MKINLKQIYKGLDEWRAERKITAQSQKDGYIINIMEELGELAQALRDYEKIKKGGSVTRAGTFDIKSTLGEMTIFEGTTKGELEVSLEIIEHEIIDALCDIAVFTINAGADSNYKPQTIDTNERDGIVTQCANYSLKNLLTDCGAFNIYSCYCGGDLLDILTDCAKLCEQYGFNFEIAMLETIKEITSRTGSYDEKAKKWIKDTSDEARAKWYKADYEKARLYKRGFTANIVCRG